MSTNKSACVTLTLVDDREDSHNLVRDLFVDTTADNTLCDVTFDSSVSVRVTGPTALEQLKSALVAFVGPMAILLDLDLRLKSEREAAKGRIHLCLEKLPETDEDALRAIAFVDNLDESTDAHVVEGVDIALTALRNSNIQPLMIRVQTSRGANQEVHHLLRQLGRATKRDVKTLCISARSEYLKGASTTDAGEIVRTTIEEFRRTFCTSGLQRFHGQISETDVNDIGNWKTTRVLLSHLLALSPDQFDGMFGLQKNTKGARRKISAMLQAVKTMGAPRGLNGDWGFGVGGAWLFALAVCREIDPSRNWLQDGTFRATDIARRGLKQKYVTPSLGHTERAGAIGAFVEVCRALFAPANDSGLSRLKEVRLSLQDGLTFDVTNLNVHDEAAGTSVVGGLRSLSAQASHMTSGMSPQVEDNSVAERIWRFCTSGLVAATGAERESWVFATPSVWRMNLKSSGGHTTCVFHDLPERRMDMPGPYVIWRQGDQLFVKSPRVSHTVVIKKPLPLIEWVCAMDKIRDNSPNYLTNEETQRMICPMSKLADAQRAAQYQVQRFAASLKKRYGIAATSLWSAVAPKKGYRIEASNIRIEKAESEHRKVSRSRVKDVVAEAGEDRIASDNRRAEADSKETASSVRQIIAGLDEVARAAVTVMMNVLEKLPTDARTNTLSGEQIDVCLLQLKNQQIELTKNKFAEIVGDFRVRCTNAGLDGGSR